MKDGVSVGGETIDPVTFEVLRRALSSVVDEMAVMLEKVAFSTVVSEGRDFSGAICSPTGDLVAQGEQDLPLIGGTIPFRVKAIIEAIGDGIDDGDMFLFNDPYLGGTHAQDVSLVMPVFWEGELFAFVQTSAHWPDLGGSMPGSFDSEAESCFEEALMIPPVHLVREGVLDEDILRLILRNLRVPRVVRGDALAMIEACKIGEARVKALLESYGPELLSAEMDAVMDYSERRLREEFAKLPDGVYEWSDAIDSDPALDNDDPLPVRLKMTIAGDQATYDFTGTAPQAGGPVNAPYSSCFSAAVATTKAVYPEIPVNQGLFRAIELIVPEGTVVSAQFPAPVSGVACGAAEKVVSCVHGCFMQLVPERSMACPANLMNICLGGFDPRPGREEDYVMYCWLAGGWGARPGRKDNFTALVPLASGTKLQPAEFLERAYPILVEGYGLEPDSEGAGRHRSGFGLRFPVRLTDGRAVLSVLGDRGTRVPWGYDGGHSPGNNGIVTKADTDSAESIGVMRAGVRVEDGDLLRYWCGGGGGWGHPFERPAEWVLDDVIDELVSVERARDVYGVVIHPHDPEALDYELDVEATQRLRAERLNE
jgi:N-methylhydantoinase B